MVKTLGIINTFNGNIQTKFPLYEIDSKKDEDITKVVNAYKVLMLDCISHPTKKGIHFLSPTVISAFDWGVFMKILDGLGDAPMVTLRVQNNKYAEWEESDFYNGTVQCHYPYNVRRNSIEMCDYLNKTYLAPEQWLKGKLAGSIKFQSYLTHVKHAQAVISTT